MLVRVSLGTQVWDDHSAALGDECTGLDSREWATCARERWTLGPGGCKDMSIRGRMVELSLSPTISKAKQAACCRVDFPFPNPICPHLRFTELLLIQLWPYFMWTNYPGLIMQAEYSLISSPDSISELLGTGTLLLPELRRAVWRWGARMSGWACVGVKWEGGSLHLSSTYHRA